MTDKTVSFEKTLISMSETTNSNAFDLDFESATDIINNQKKEDIEKSNKSTKLVPVELTAVENQFLAEKNSDCEVEVSLRSQSQGTQFKTSIVEDERQHECSKQDNFKENATGVCDSTVVAPSDLEPVDGRNIYGESGCFDEELSKLTKLNDEIEKMFPKETYHIEEKADTFSKEKPNAIDTDIQRSLESSEYNQDENKNVDKTSCVQEPIEIINNEDALPNENRSPSYDTNGNTNVSREQYKRETEGSCEAQDKDIFEIKCETNRECKPEVNRDVINFELKHLTEDCSHPSVSSRQSRESSKTVQKCVLNTISLETDSNIKPSSQIISTSAKELKTDKNVTSGESTCVYNDVNEIDIENELIDECFVNKKTEHSKTETGIQALLKLSDKDLERDSLTMHKEEEEEEDTSVNISLNGNEELENLQRNEDEAQTSNNTFISKSSKILANNFEIFQSNDSLIKNTYEGDDKLSTIKARCDAIDKQNKLCIDVETCSVQKEEASKHSKPQVTVFKFEAISFKHVKSDKKEERKIIKIKAGRSPTKQVSNSSQSATTGLINSTNVGSEVTSFQKPDDQQEDVQDLRSKLYCKSHHDVVKFWCMDCKKSVCEKCINIFNSELCIRHQLKSLKLLVSNKKEKWEKEIQKNSNNCLKVLDHAFKELQRNERESQFQALIQRDRIHQEFISFHHLLIDEENKILKHLEKTLDEHSLQTSESQKKYGSLIDEEASLMCESVRSIDEDDSFDTDLSVFDSLTHTQDKWKKLENEAIELFSSIQPLPNAINKMFSFKHLKTAIGEHLESVVNPFPLCTVKSTMFLDDEFIVAPIKVSDLFLYLNSRRMFSEIFLYIELICDKKIKFKKVLNMSDYVFNFYGGYYLHPYKRYIVKAKHVTSNEVEQVKSDHSKERHKHILVVTGKGPRTTYSMRSEGRVQSLIANTDCSQRQTCRRIINTYQRNRTRVFQSIGFLQWRQSKMWPFSAVKGCKDLYDISPEEMRSLAYRLDKSSYVSLENDLTDTFDVMCSNDEKELLDNLNLIYQIRNANVKLDFEMKTVQEQEMEIQRESFNEQLSSLKEEIDSKQYYIDQLKQENEKLSVTVVKLNEDTCKKQHNELESVMMTGKSSHIQNDELEERDLACLKKSTSQMDEKDGKEDDVFII
ncbi:uncharacterized protein LOC143073109 isoform X2 [Mytilus galloprovincialis]|uniref:uncharacterized protein LOC143073109 isoform X2 n=1 Tax=Mytilus galloprovincialis TaxID=29158 RepID=UPI003F7BDFD8